MRKAGSAGLVQGPGAFGHWSPWYAARAGQGSLTRGGSWLLEAHKIRWNVEILGRLYFATDHEGAVDD